MQAKENSSSPGSVCPPLIRPVMPELDAIRGLAIIGVLFYHGLYWNVELTKFPHFARLIFTAFWLGRQGVNLFFVLSGFLITGILLDSRSRPDYYRRFYIRRILRIVPAYFLTLLILVVFTHTPWNSIGLSLLYLSNIAPLLGVSIGYPVLWSLAVEEHFYLVWPAIVRKFGLRGLMLCCGVIILASPLSRLVTFLNGEKNGFVRYVCNEYTWNSADGLACGALFAIYLRLCAPTRPRLIQQLVATVVLAFSVWSIAMPWGIWTRQRPVGAALQVVPLQFLFVAVLAFFLIVGTSDWADFVRPKTLIFFGEISYGLYLYHLLVFALVDYIAKKCSWPLISTQNPLTLLIRFSVSCLVAVLLSAISRRLFEDRFLAMKYRLT